MLQRLLAISVAAGLIAVSLGACREAEDEIRNTIECGEVCETWNDCHGTTGAVEVDVAECTLDCEDEADANDDFAEQVDDCEDCLDATANQCAACWSQCPSFPVAD